MDYSCGLVVWLCVVVDVVEGAGGRAVWTARWIPRALECVFVEEIMYPRKSGGI